MVRPSSWETLPSIEVYPQKTFFGLDKGKSHCFTIIKKVNKKFITRFSLDSKNLQRRVTFVINGTDYEADIRLVIMNRSKTRKLKPEEQKEREIIQFQWHSYPRTCDIFRQQMAEPYNKILKGDVNYNEAVIFVNSRLNRFFVEFTDKKRPIFEARI